MKRRKQSKPVPRGKSRPLDRVLLSPRHLYTCQRLRKNEPRPDCDEDLCFRWCGCWQPGAVVDFPAPVASVVFLPSDALYVCVCSRKHLEGPLSRRPTEPNGKCSCLWLRTCKWKAPVVKSVQENLVISVKPIKQVLLLRAVCHQVQKTTREKRKNLTTPF